MQLTRRTRALALAAALLAVATLARDAAAQQAGTIRGTVTDSATQRRVPGVQISITGSTRGAVTNDAGEFLIRDLGAGTYTLRAQRIGYSPTDRRVTLEAGGTTAADFVLRPVAATLSQVVVVGYGTTRREEVTSAVTSVSSEDIANTPLAGIDAALQGRAPGVQVMQNAGNPGNGISIRVRGPASVNAGTQPLWVVDGVPILQENYSQLGTGGQDITAVTGLNPDEIATIDILKDAAASAIYGSRGSNGVVLVTTKRGQAGRGRVTLSAYTGTQSANRRVKLLNAEQYVQLYNESAKNDDYDEEDYPFVAGVDDANTYDWQDAVFRSAPVSNMQLGFSGGSDRVQYYLSGTFFDQKGIVIGSGYNRASGRANLDFSATDRLSFRTSIGLTREDHDRIDGDGSLDGVVTNAIGLQPFVPIRRADGRFAGGDEGLRYSNPVALATINSNTLQTLRGLGNIEATFRANDAFTLTGRAGFDVLNLDETEWNSPEVDLTYAASANGVGQTDHTTASKYVLESFATIEPFRSATQRLEVVGGASVEWNQSALNFVRGEGFTSGFRKYIRNAAIVTSYDGSRTENNLASFFARANYALRDRYLFSAAIRRDGSSRFGEENRYGVFTAGSVGWVVSEEPFAQALRRMGSLKLRGSYGTTGNQAIGDFASLGTATGAPYNGVPGIAPSSLGNPNLGWEQTRETDIGVDLSVFDGRATLIADWYRRNTSDLLVSRPISATSGYTSIWDNIGGIRNTGIDLGLQLVPLRASSGGLGWTMDANVTFNKNEVTSLHGNQEFTTGINGRETSVVRVGQPMGSFYMLKFDGVDPETGNAIFDDFDGDGSITSADRQIVGNPHPDYYGGLSNTLTFGNLDLRAFLQFSKGNEVFNMMRIFTDDGGCSWDNLDARTLRRWQKPGDITDVPRMSYDCVSGADDISSRFIEDGSYLRLGEVTLGFRVPSRLATSLRMEGLRMYVSGRNLHTWTKYTGYNPDVNSAGSDENVILGTDYYAYPLARTFTFGITASW